jgi:phage baseplate assembly protein gpV
MLKVAKVTQIDAQKGMVKVVILENSTETNWISMLSTEYQVPKVGAMVMVYFDREDYTCGLCFGEYFSDSNLPAAADAQTYYKRMGNDVVLKYNTSTKTLDIFADNVNIHGDLFVSGNISAKNL